MKFLASPMVILAIGVFSASAFAATPSVVGDPGCPHLLDSRDIVPEGCVYVFPPFGAEDETPRALALFPDDGEGSCALVSKRAVYRDVRFGVIFSGVTPGRPGRRAGRYALFSAEGQVIYALGGSSGALAQFARQIRANCAGPHIPQTD